ncbi:uncharacterized protein [Nicotiana sylvestris]|uniref:uncharacterized protein n=1 Tax=Nicotiana sylvestris TaxID=4096 RepID=UPI00388C9104
MIEIVHKGEEPKKPSQTVMMILYSEIKPVKKPIVEGLVNKLSVTNSEPSAVVKKGSPSDVAAKQEKSKVVVPGAANKPIIIVEGARTDPVIINHVTQLSVVNSKAIPWNCEWVIVTYKRKEVKEEVNEAQGLTRSRRCFAPEELRKAKTFRDNPIIVKKEVTEEEAEEFLRKMKVQNYSIVEQLRKNPAQISLLSLLIHSDEHRRAFMKILNEAHVTDKISVNYLEKIANKIFEVNRVTFSDDELPVEGTEHNRALYLTVKYEDSVFTRGLVDNGSSANIFPLSTLNKLKVDDERIHKNSICVRGFDGRGKDSADDIVLELIIGPVEFTMEFQEIVVHGEDNLCAHSDVSVPFIEVEDDKGPWGIIQLVYLPKNLGTFGLGFKPIAADVKRAKRLKQKAWALPKPVLRLSRSFVKPSARKRPVMIVQSFVVDIDEELVERFQRLFDDVNMVEVGEGSSKADVQFVGPNAKLNNWKASSLPTWKESCDMTCMRNLWPSLKSQSNSEIIIQEIECNDESEYDEDEAFEKISLSTDLVVHKLPIDPAFLPVKQKLRKFKTDMSVKIKEEVTKQLDAKVIWVTQYPTWLANVVPVPKKDGKTRFDIVYVTRTAIKAQALADHLAENLVDEEYEPLKTYFPDEEVMHIDEGDKEEKLGWKLFFDGATNMKGVGIVVVLISEIGHPTTAQLCFYCTNNMAEYEACILGLRLAVDMGIQEVMVLGDSDLLVYQIQEEWETRDLKLIPYRQCLHDLCQRFRSIDFRHIPRIHNEVVDALATLASMLHHSDKALVDTLHIQVRDQDAYCNVVEEEIDGGP